MKSIKQCLRLLRINYVMAKNGLDRVVFSMPWFSPLRFISYFNPWNWSRRKPLSRGEAIRKTLEELGPIFVKFGQALSTRPDLWPADVALELCKLQDNVPSFNSEEAVVVVEQAFGSPIADIFAQFDTNVLASASIAQVHAAKLKTGEDVVVKILRPGIKAIIKQDLSILHTIAYLADKYWKASRRLKPKEIVREFEHNLLDELNLQHEAANAAQLRRNFKGTDLLHVPEVHWDYVRPNVMVIERIYGIPVTHVELLHQHGINIKKLAQRGIEIFFTQVFYHGFFHADMHPGNIFVSYEHPEDPQYICIDFGIMGALDDEDKRYLAENLLAFFNQDYRRVAQLHVESGWVASGTRVQDLEKAIRTVCEPIFEKPLKDISFAFLVTGLFQVARRFHMEVQPQLILLQKTLLATEGLGRQLYPELDLWATAKPILEKWLRRQWGIKSFVKHIKDNVPFFIEQLPHMPRLLNDVLSLSKEHQRILLTKENEEEIKARYRHYKKQGFAKGLLIACIGVGALHYFDLFASQSLMLNLFLGIISAGLLAYVYHSSKV